MTRDHENLRVFVEADVLATEMYRITKGFPDGERFGLQAQLRRAAVSVAANIVEGASRSSIRDYGRFLEVARGSSRECAYLIRLGCRLDFMPNTALAIASRYEGLSAGLFATMKKLER